MNEASLGLASLGVTALGLRSDIALLDADVAHKGDCIVVRSPAEPSFYWGNLLVFPQPPKTGDRARWEARFATEFEDLPGVRHQTFVWDVSDRTAEIVEFTEAGYEVDSMVVLTAKRVVLPPHPNSEVEIRVLSADEEWGEVADLQVLTRDDGHDETEFRAFTEARLASLRRRVMAGAGCWYGAYLAGELVASLGVFWAETLARFQIVVTHPKARRQGICGTLVHHASVRALALPEVEALVMIADTEYHAARIYEAVGFSPAEQLVGVCKWPKS